MEVHQKKPTSVNQMDYRASTFTIFLTGDCNQFESVDPSFVSLVQVGIGESIIAAVILSTDFFSSGSDEDVNPPGWLISKG